MRFTVMVGEDCRSSDVDVLEVGRIVRLRFPEPKSFRGSIDEPGRGDAEADSGECPGCPLASGVR